MSEIPAFVSTGGAVLIVAAIVVACLIALAVGVCRSAALGDEQQQRDVYRDGLPNRWERQAASNLYSLRSYERRTDHVGPVR